jgi:LuxR family transcriptional regulator, maltose regulon positive regulatory protein
MDDTDVRERPDRAPRAGGTAFDLTVSKLLRPRARAGTIRRSSLLDRLAAGDPRRIVSVVAPPGYGKTTLLSQWADSGGPPFAWVSVDEKDNDPKVLLAYVTAALDAIEPVGRRVFDALASPASSVPGSVVPRLASAFAAMTVPVVLVLDDVHLLGNRECRDALSVLAEHVPAGSRLVLAGRAEPPLRAARLRAEGRLLEIGPADLSLTREEAAALLREAGLVLGADEVAVLQQRTEGWPAGLYLAALYLREGGSLPGSAVSFGGDDWLVSQYLESEFLARISRRDRVFLTRTAVLERMSGALCEEVLEQSGAAAALTELARSNLLLVPLDRRGVWYRYHHLFRDMLLARLEQLEPDLMPVLRRRAAAWCLDNDLLEEALEYSIAAGDVDAAAHVVERLAVPARRQGRTTTLRRWFGWLDERGGIERHAMVTVLAALIYAWMGRPREADRWADMTDAGHFGDAGRPDDPAVAGWAALLRAFMCRHGVGQMLADADEASYRFASHGIVTAGPALLQGLARALSGDLAGGDVSLADAVSVGKVTAAHEVLAAALSERSLLAMARGEWDRAEALAGQAGATLDQAGIEASYVTPLVCAVKARTALHRGDVAAARRELVSAQRMRPVLTYAIPHVAVQARIELIHAHLALADLAGAKTLMRETDDLLKRRPDLGALAEQAAALRARLSKERGADTPAPSSLTTAELRILPMLATHLSFPEIGAELFLSPNTVKSQAMSVYRKLGASSRSQAVTRSRELGLLEG